MEQNVKRESVRVDELTPHPGNYRSHPQDQIDHIKQSLKEHGLYRSIVVADDNTILAGHGVAEAVRQLGWEYVDVSRVPVDPNSSQAMKLLAGDNELARIAEVDDRALTELLREVNRTAEDGLLGTGFDEMMLSNLVMITRTEDEIQDIDEAAEWVGMPEYSVEEKPYQLMISFRNEEDRERFVQGTDVSLFKKREGARVWSAWWPPKERNALDSVRVVPEDSDDENEQ